MAAPGLAAHARQTALVEAIGFGDVEGLASLRPIGAELEQPVPAPVRRS